MRSIGLGLWFVTVAAGLAACSDLEGNGEIVTQTRTVAGFSAVDAENGVRVILTVDPDAAGDVDLAVTTDSNLQNRLTTNVSGGALRVTVQRTAPGSEFEVVATISSLADISASNGAIVVVTGAASDLTLSASDGAIIMGEDLAVSTVEVDGANGALITICASGQVTGELTNGAILTVLCGGSVTGVETSNGGIVLTQ
jgi:hypothetical protein